MKERLKKILPILGILCGACLVLAAVVLGEQVPKGMGGALFGTGGALMGLGVSGIAMDVIWRRMSEDERIDAALQQLEELTRQGLVKQGSVYTDAENGMVSFTYSCGALGGILLTDTESEADAALPGPELEDAPALLAAENGTVGNAVSYTHLTLPTIA